jgi:hypothetical protein
LKIWPRRATKCNHAQRGQKTAAYETTEETVGF